MHGNPTKPGTASRLARHTVNRVRQNGSMEGRLLVLLGVALIVSIGLMAWFSAPPDSPAGADDAQQASEAIAN
jgi:hypothetical protein